MDADDRQVRVFGYGEYAGDEIPPEGVSLDLDILAEVKCPNPKIVLDSGQVVWGCECWWGPEAKAAAWIGKRAMVNVDIEAERARVKFAVPGEPA